MPEDWEASYCLLLTQTPWNLALATTKLLVDKGNLEGTGRVESPRAYIRIPCLHSLLGLSYHLASGTTPRTGARRTWKHSYHAKLSDGPEGTFWNMYNPSHLEIYLIKWDFFKEWEIIYKDKNNSALPQKCKNKFCTFSAWLREGGREGGKTERIWETEYILVEAK